ncbi:MAG: hypothetical protein CK541_04455 [Opitutia bacterium]|nr:MAG: hypothetical protein CK541_04455 [Opitutae bacterium]
MKTLSLFLACAACLVGLAAEAPSADTFADLAVAEKRIAAQQAIFDHSRSFVMPSPEAKAWFNLVRDAAKASEDPEVKAALAQVLLLDPANKRALPLNPKQPNTYEAPEGTTPETKLAQLERLLDLKRSAKDLPLSVEELVALTKHEDFATAQRANRLLRRISATAAAPILWERLAKLTQRSQVQEVEDEILRLTPTLAVRYLPTELAGASLAAKAAWARIISVRAGRVGSKSRPAIKAAMLPLLKGPANELTEAAWAAVPRLFTEADRAALTEASQGLSERMAPKAKAALEALPAK